jgi:hypothetical protein
VSAISTAIAAKASPMPTQQRLGPDSRENLQHRRNQRYSGQRTSDRCCESNTATQLAANNQLMSKHRVLSFKPPLRLEWRGQDSQNETEQ